MAFFDKKKSPAEKVIEMIEALSDEDKELVMSRFTEKAEDLEKAEDEREIDKIEEEKADTEEIKEEKAEDVKEESEEIGKDVNEAEAEEPKVEEEAVEEVGETKETEEPETNGLEARIKALEDKFDKVLESIRPEENKEIGISGYGNSEMESTDIDNRREDMIKKLGGRA